MMTTTIPQVRPVTPMNFADVRAAMRAYQEALTTYCAAVNAVPTLPHTRTEWDLAWSIVLVTESKMRLAHAALVALLPVSAYMGPVLVAP